MHEGDNPSFWDKFIEFTFFLDSFIHIRIFKRVPKYLSLIKPIHVGSRISNIWEKIERAGKCENSSIHVHVSAIIYTKVLPKSFWKIMSEEENTCLSPFNPPLLYHMTISMAHVSHPPMQYRFYCSFSVAKALGKIAFQKVLKFKSFTLLTQVTIWIKLHVRPLGIWIPLFVLILWDWVRLFTCCWWRIVIEQTTRRKNGKT
jgi:hypothetical protein